jgi:hypothetical protein
MDFFTGTVITGVGATLVMDVWGSARKPLLGIPSPDYAPVGRWIAYMARGKFRHQAIAAVPPVHGERLLGWIVHYLTGITFAAILLGSQGSAWLLAPTLGPALLVGLGTVAAPFLLMQPAMGAGIAASRTPRPAAARLQSLVTHAVFGLGLYAGGWMTHLLYPA